MTEEQRKMLDLLSKLDIETEDKLYKVLDGFTDVTDTVYPDELRDNYSLEDDKAELVHETTHLFAEKVYEVWK